MITFEQTNILLEIEDDMVRHLLDNKPSKKDEAATRVWETKMAPYRANYREIHELRIAINIRDRKLGLIK